MAMNFWYIYQKYKEKVESKPLAIIHILDQNSKYKRYNTTYLYLDVSYQLQYNNSSRYLKNGEHNK